MSSRDIIQAAAGVGGDKLYVDDVFSTYLYTGNGSTQAIFNNVPLASTDAFSVDTVSINSFTSSVHVDSSGNRYLTYSQASPGLVTVKYSSTGSIIWQKYLKDSDGGTFDNSEAIVTTDSSGNVYTAGALFSPVGTTTYTQVVKYNSSGTVQWQRRLTQGSPNSVTPYDIKVDSSGNVYVATSRGLVKLSSTGSSVWQVYVSTISTAIRSLHVDESGNVFVVGGAVDGTYNAGFLIKLDSSGAVQWQRKVSTSSSYNHTDIISDSNGDLCLVGKYTSGTSVFGLVYKYDTSGNLLWQRRFYKGGSPTLGDLRVVCDNANNIYAYGHFYINSIDYVHVFKYSSDGTYQSRVMFDIGQSNAITAGKPALASADSVLFPYGQNAAGIIELPTTLSVDGVLNLSSSGSLIFKTVAETWTLDSGGPSDAAGSFTVGTSSLSIGTTTCSTGNGTSTLTRYSQDKVTSQGGMVWIKRRSAGTDHEIFDTDRGAGYYLQSNDTVAQAFASIFISSFNANGFSIGGSSLQLNYSGEPYASWTFRKAPKFFDVVTYTGTGAQLTVSHGLQSTPGMIIIRRTDSAANWIVWHRSLGSSYYGTLNSTEVFYSNAIAQNLWPASNVSTTSFTVGSGLSSSGGTYVAYLFAHDAGGFGDGGSDNVISCGSYTGTGSDLSVNLGYEPQFVIIKNSTNAYNWQMHDNMRGVTTNGNDARLHPNLSNAEATDADWLDFNATGFTVKGGLGGNLNASGHGYIYIAIRRPMKPPSAGTEVFSPVTYTGDGVDRVVTSGFATDVLLGKQLSSPGTQEPTFVDRLRGTNQILMLSNTSAESTSSSIAFDTQDGVKVNAISGIFNNNGSPMVGYFFKRAPGFFDMVCYTGTGVATTVNHNLTVAPEMMIFKSRNAAARNWLVYHKDLGANYYLWLQTNDSAGISTAFLNNTVPTSSLITIGTTPSVNTSSETYVAYLFATLPGISKVGSYTGNGTNQTINCGFTSGARFVLIKRTDSTGDWYVWDTARGIVSANDPHLSLNTAVAQVTTDDSVDPDSTGFIVNQVAATNVNVSSATYIYLAIA